MPLAAMFFVQSGWNYQILQRTFHRCFIWPSGFRNQPTKNKNCVWWPCLLTKWALFLEDLQYMVPTKFWFIRVWTFFSLISQSDIVNINELTLILKIIGQCDVKCIMTILIKIIMTVLKVLTYTITSITAFSIRLAIILVIM